MNYLPLFLSLKFNCKKRCEKIVYITSIISTTSISFAVAVLIIGLSIMNGFEYELHNRILSLIPHVEIEKINELTNNYNTVIKSIKNAPNFIQGIKYIKFSGLIEKCNKLKAIQIQSIDRNNEQKFSNLINFIIGYKNWHDFKSNKKNIIIGSGLAKSLNIKINDWVTIHTTRLLLKSKYDNQSWQPETIRLHVSGILNSNSFIDQNIVLLTLEDAQKLLNIGNNVTGIAIKIKKPFKVQNFINNLKIDSNFNVYSWMDKYGYIYQDIKMIRSMICITMLLIIIAACFNIFSTVMVTVKNKTTDIIILKNLGATKQLINKVFFIYGLQNCIYGTFIGSILGILISLKFNHIIKFIEHLIDYHLFSKNVYFINFIPSKIHVLDIILIISVVFIMSLLASWYPANYANKINNSRLLLSKK